jgi:hypothetical protein
MAEEYRRRLGNAFRDGIRYHQIRTELEAMPKFLDSEFSEEVMEDPTSFTGLVSHYRRDLEGKEGELRRLDEIYGGDDLAQTHAHSIKLVGAIREKLSKLETGEKN